MWLRWGSISNGWRCTLWSSPIDSCIERAVFPPRDCLSPCQCEKIAQFETELLRDGTETINFISPLHVVILLMRRDGMWCVPNPMSPPHPEVVQFLYSFSGSETDYFSFPFLFLTVRKRDLWNYWTSSTTPWELTSLHTGWVKTWLWGWVRDNISSV